MSLKALITILAVSMLTIGTLTSALAVSPKTDSYEEDASEQLYVPGEILVKFNPGVSEAKIRAINSKNGASVTYTSPYAGFKKLNIPKTKSVEEMVQIYSRNPNVEYAVPNAITHAFSLPNDPLYPLQWSLNNSKDYGINIVPAWEISTGDDVVVAVLDTGVAYENYVQNPRKRYYQAPDLANTHFVSGYDFVNGDSHPNDDDSHGTHVTGTIAQSTNNGIGVAGVAYNCFIMPVKVLGPRGGTLDQLVSCHASIVG
ncbi:MAG: S8 family serine peptidase [Methanosarcinaceae archaeon]|nr:S8 family serine peptidase [Methanosarcinaceae archaeon]